MEKTQLSSCFLVLKRISLSLSLWIECSVGGSKRAVRQSKGERKRFALHDEFTPPTHLFWENEVPWVPFQPHWPDFKSGHASGVDCRFNARACVRRYVLHLEPQAQGLTIVLSTSEVVWTPNGVEFRIAKHLRHIEHQKAG